MPSAYCDECGWEYRADGDDGELSRAMIDHFVETGHSPVERRDAADRLADERAAPSDETGETVGEPSKKR